MSEIGGEEMISCPYNRYHVVKKHRIQKHILKCKKNHPEITLATCVYNYSHRLKPEELLKHFEICRCKIRLDGTRYYEANNLSRVRSVRSKQQNTCFPNINFEACFPLEPKFHSQMDHPDSQELDSSSSGFEMPQLKNNHTSHFSDDTHDRDTDNDFEPQLKNNHMSHFSDDTHDRDTDNDFEPLPLPKTVSKAFVCVKKEEKSDPSETSRTKGFGRGRNFAMCSSPKPPQATDHLLPDLSNMKFDTVERNRSPWFSPKNDDSICSQSVRSSMFDDATTLKSVDISLDEDVLDDIILKDFNKHVKI